MVVNIPLLDKSLLLPPGLTSHCYCHQAPQEVTATATRPLKSLHCHQAP